MIVGAAEQALSMVASVRDDPIRRLQLAGRLYDDRPDQPSIHRYRRAELAFMRWQVSRGVLAPMGPDRSGSAWWRAVNEGLLRDAWEAALLVTDAPGPPSRRAAELPVERFFMDVALGRVLFVQALVSNPRLAVGRWARPLGRLLGDPRWRGADLYLSLRNMLPKEYPLTGLTIADVLENENLLGRLIDYGVLLPRAQALYEFAANELSEPALLDFILNGNLVYAWPYEDRDAWVAVRSKALCALVARATST